MKILENFLKKHPAEKILKDYGYKLGKIKKFLSAREYKYVLDFVEKLGNDISYVESPSELITPVGTFNLPLIVLKEGVYYVFLPSIGEFDEEAIDEIIVLSGFVKKNINIRSEIIISDTERQNLPTIVDFYTSSNPLTSFLTILYVDSKIARKGKDPVVLMKETFYKIFKKKLDAGIQALDLIDKYFTLKGRCFSSEIINSKPFIIATDILYTFIEQVFANELKATIVEQGKLSTGKSYLLFKTELLIIDIKGKILYDVRNKGHLSIVNLMEEVSKLVANPGITPPEDCFPFLEWQVFTEEVRQLQRPQKLVKVLEQIAQWRLDLIENYEAYSFDGWVRIYRCSHCGTYDPRLHKFHAPLFQTVIDMKDFLIQRITNDLNSEVLSDYCASCGKMLTPEEIIYTQLQRYLPDVKLDLQISQERLPRGNIFYLWQSMDKNKKIKGLGTEFTDRNFHFAFGRHVSTAPLFINLLEQSIITKKAEMEKIDDDFILLVMPPFGIDNPYAREALSELMAPLKKVGKKYKSYVINRPEITRKSLFKYGYLKWSLNFREKLSSGKYKMVVMLDVESLYLKFCSMLTGYGLIPELEGEVCRIDDGRYQICFNLSYKIQEMINMSAYPAEFFERFAGEIIRTMENIGRLNNYITETFKEDLEISFERRTGCLRLVNRTNKKETMFNLYGFAKRNDISAHTAGDIIIRSALKCKAHPLLCKCGNPACTFIRLASVEMSNKIKTGFYKDKPLSLAEKNLLFYFIHGCKEHKTILTEKEAHKMGITEQMLLGKVLCDLDFDLFEVNIFSTSFLGREYILVTGNSAATLGTFGGWIKQIISLCYYSFIPNKVAVYSNNSNSLIITDHSASIEEIKSFTYAQRERIQKELTDAGRVELYNVINLPGIGSGNINVLTYEY